MTGETISEVMIVPSGGTFTDAEGHAHFIKGYGGGKDLPLELDPAIDLTSPILQQVQELDDKGIAERESNYRR